MFKYLGFIFRVVPLIIWNYFTWILRYSWHKDKYPLEKRYQKARKFMTKALKRLHVEIHAEGLENLNSEGVKMWTPDHQGLLDPVVLIALSEKPVSFIAKLEVKKMPVVGRVFKIIDGEFIDRKDLLQTFRILKIMDKSLLNNEHDWAIFPEGTRNKNRDEVIMNEFHPGTFKSAFKENIVVLPMVIEGTYRVLDKKIHMRRYPVYVKYLTPVNNDIIKANNSTEYRDYVFNEMAEVLKEIREKNNSYLK